MTQAVEHNNVLDILKVGGLMGTCLGVLLLVVALIFPPGRHPSTWAEEDDTPQISQINQVSHSGFYCPPISSIILE